MMLYVDIWGCAINQPTNQWILATNTWILIHKEQGGNLCFVKQAQFPGTPIFFDPVPCLTY